VAKPLRQPRASYMHYPLPWWPHSSSAVTSWGICRAANSALGAHALRHVN